MLLNSPSANSQNEPNVTITFSARDPTQHFRFARRHSLDRGVDRPNGVYPVLSLLAEGEFRDWMGLSFTRRSLSVRLSIAASIPNRILLIGDTARVCIDFSRLIRRSLAQFSNAEGQGQDSNCQHSRDRRLR